MTIAQDRRPILLLLLLFIFIGSVFTSIALDSRWHDLQLINEPLHATLEAYGGMAAVAMALILFQLNMDAIRGNREYFILAMGFIVLGSLNALHAVSTFGNGFILLLSLADFLGGCWFALVWFPGITRHLVVKNSSPWWAACLSVLLGILVLTKRGYFPAMRQLGEFTPFAIAINLAAGILILTAAGYFLRQFLRSSKTESYLFTCMFLLLGLSALQFPFSVDWNNNWWFWHVQRCLAFTVVFYYLYRTFLRISADLKKANELLEIRIAARTEELSKEVAERIRYGSERDKVITELQGALVQINTLTGLLPTCASCKKIRDADGNWVEMESYIQNNSTARFSHGICPVCAKELYPEIYPKLFDSSGQPLPTKP